MPVSEASDNDRDALLRIADLLILKPDQVGAWQGEPLPSKKVLRSSLGRPCVVVAEAEADPREHKHDVEPRSVLCVPVRDPGDVRNVVDCMLAAVRWLRAWPDDVLKSILLFPWGTALFAYRPLLTEGAKRNVGAFVLLSSIVDATTPDELRERILRPRLNGDTASTIGFDTLVSPEDSLFFSYGEQLGQLISDSLDDF
jgi:hypothetical protein